jgi:hypothetical protein
MERRDVSVAIFSKPISQISTTTVFVMVVRRVSEGM